MNEWNSILVMIQDWKYGNNKRLNKSKSKFTVTAGYTRIFHVLPWNTSWCKSCIQKGSVQIMLAVYVYRKCWQWMKDALSHFRILLILSYNSWYISLSAAWYVDKLGHYRWYTTVVYWYFTVRSFKLYISNFCKLLKI